MNWDDAFGYLKKVVDDNPISRKLAERANLERLLHSVQAHKEYAWFQGAEKGVAMTGGICHGMSFDWLRRKFLGKRNYNDPCMRAQSKIPEIFRSTPR